MPHKQQFGAVLMFLSIAALLVAMILLPIATTASSILQVFGCVGMAIISASGLNGSAPQRRDVVFGTFMLAMGLSAGVSEWGRSHGLSAWASRASFSLVILTAVWYVWLTVQEIRRARMT
jgi:hypothetical protein